MEIVFEDDDLIVIHKEAGVATQTANIRDKDCVSLIKEHLSKSKGVKGDIYVGVIHRLDQPVEGLLVFAKNPKCAAVLSKAVTSDMMSKRYRALVEGRIDTDKLLSAAAVRKLEDNRYEVRDYLYKDAKNKVAVIVENGSKKCTDEKAKEAVLEFSINEYFDDINRTEILIDLKTGRFHQIRCQMANLGYPIAGDRKYGAKMPYQLRQIGLTATDLSFVHPGNHKRMNFSLD